MSESTTNNHEISAPPPTLYSQLVEADETSLSIIAGGSAAIDEFTHFWSNIQSLLKNAMHENAVDAETLALAHKVASRIETVTERLLKLYEEVEIWSAAFTEMDSLFMELSLEDRDVSWNKRGKHYFIDALRFRLMPALPLAPEDADALQFPSYIKPAYMWLIRNLHNPYPSKSTKTAISEQTGSSVGYLDNWFRDVRKRIGWTSLCKRHFSNKRTLIVQAATSIFKGVPFILKSGSYTKFRHINTDRDVDFTQIESNAKDLYSGKFGKTRLVVTLDAAVKDLTPEIQARVQSESQYQGDTNAALSYPTPHRSPQPSSAMGLSASVPEQRTSRKRPSGRSPDVEHNDRRVLKRSKPNPSSVSDDIAAASIPSPVSPVVESPTVESINDSASLSPLPTIAALPHPTIIGKWKRQSSDTVDHTPSSTSLPVLADHTEKRQRHTCDVGDNTSPPVPCPAVAFSPSYNLPGKRKRQISDEGDRVSSPRPSTSLNLDHDISPITFSKRKRRLSDAQQMHAKRPHNAMVTPRHQTVSDPFPISKPADSDSFAYWWQECLQNVHELDMAEVPATPVVIEKLDDSTPLDIHYEGYHYADITSSIPELDLWPNHVESSAHASTHFSNFTSGELFVDQAFSNPSGDQGIQSSFQGFENTSFGSHNSAFNANVNECSTSYSNNNLFLPDVIDQTTGMCLFAGLSLPESWTFDDFNPGPQLFMPQLIPDSISSTPSIHDSYGLDDKVAKHERAERLREELRRLEADLAS